MKMINLKLIHQQIKHFNQVLVVAQYQILRCPKNFFKIMIMFNFLNHHQIINL